MANIKTFRDLKIWEKARGLVLSIYRITKGLPPEETYGLISQMHRTALSTAANIVEGFRRTGFKDSLRFSDIANASLEELRYEVQVSHDLGYIGSDALRVANGNMEEVSKMLNSWIRSRRRGSRRA